MIDLLKTKSIYALKHFLLSVAVGVASASFVFFLLYPPPYQSMLDVSSIFLLLLSVDIVCGPLLTWVLVSPRKSRRAHALDFSLIGILQLLALLYGLHTVWAARPVVLAFEADRLVLVTAPEIQEIELPLAPKNLQHLPLWGVYAVNTRQPQNAEEFLQAVDLGLTGISPAMRPGWWLTWDTAQSGLQERAKPIAELLHRRPKEAPILQAAIAKTRLNIEQLRYIPLTSSKTKEWVALLDAQLHIVGHAPVDGF